MILTYVLGLNLEMNSEIWRAWGTSLILKNFCNFLSLLSSETTNSIVVLKNIAVNKILIDIIIILVFLTPLEAIMVRDFREPIILIFFLTRYSLGLLYCNLSGVSFFSPNKCI